ncbi:YigZ family protein [Carnobacterium gallinarum]|uniref:YigZ family protein n=1 Tax=Carnobacterium gallinarum TaxID=2749 RepID=UPI0012F73893|nr:YigZ family protein [Carnobacterium gallinarum]
MLDHYLTIAKDGNYEIEIKKSRFICHLKRITTETEAQEFIQTIKKEHWKANHNCAAYVIGDQNQIQRALDDGEPSGTAGVPMLEVLKKQNLRDVVAVVTRYFGGTKLGAGGLIRAYGKSVSQTLHEIGIVERSLQQEIHLEVAYTASGRLENFLETSAYTIKDILYTENVSFVCYALEKQTEFFQLEVTNLLNGQVTFKLGNKSYQEKLIQLES